MGTRHVDDLFSGAYDGMLEGEALRRYDEHLAACERCAQGADDFRRAIDAVRALPAARMPVRVVLPSTPPVAERRRSRLALPVLRLPRLSPAAGGLTVALVGVAAVVLVAHGHGGVGEDRSASSAEARPAPVLADQQAATCSATPHVTALSGGAAVPTSPPGFSNRAAVTIPQRPGEELLLATTASTYAPGSQVLVYAVLTTSNPQMQMVVPCVSLQGTLVALGPTAGAPQAPAAAMNGSSGAGAGSTAGSAAAATGAVGSRAAAGGLGSGTPPPPQYEKAAPPPAAAPVEAPNSTELKSVNGALAFASPSNGFLAGGVPMQVLTIPADVPRGSALRLVAVVPAGVPVSSDSVPIEAVITIDVS